MFGSISIYGATLDGSASHVERQFYLAAGILRMRKSIWSGQVGLGQQLAAGGSFRIYLQLILSERRQKVSTFKYYKIDKGLKYYNGTPKNNILWSQYSFRSGGF